MTRHVEWSRAKRVRRRSLSHLGYSWDTHTNTHVVHIWHILACMHRYIFPFLLGSPNQTPNLIHSHIALGIKQRRRHVNRKRMEHINVLLFDGPHSEWVIWIVGGRKENRNHKNHTLHTHTHPAPDESPSDMTMQFGTTEFSAHHTAGETTVDTLMQQRAWKPMLCVGAQVHFHHLTHLTHDDCTPNRPEHQVVNDREMRGADTSRPSHRLWELAKSY